MVKTAISLIFIISLSSSYAATRVELRCEVQPAKLNFLEKIKTYLSSNESDEPKYLKIVKGLREGHTKYSSKNNDLPWKIFFDLDTGNFISTPSREGNYIDLKYFTSGLITLPDCMGATLEYVKAGFVD